MRTWFALLVGLVLLVAGALPVLAVADETAFERVWAASDGVVANGDVTRTWFWGPAPLFTIDESYREGVEGQRRVQYWDKGRMEISNPNDDPASPWYVSSGLLPIEMISGRIQTGDRDTQRRSPADIPIVGDPNRATNPNAPTYADFFAVTTVFLDSRLVPVSADPIGPIAADSPAPPRFGDLVAEQLLPGGEIQRRPDLAASVPGTRLVYYSGVLSHNIPEVFWNFLQQIESPQVNGTDRPDMLADWVYLVGYPASEPYWVTTNIDGFPQDVMVQVYERRVLTYNPDNAPSLQVQMGNTGSDYYRWRYELTSPPPAPNFVRPPNRDATVAPQEGPAGTTFAVTLFGFDPGEDVSIWLTFPDDSVLEAPQLGRANENGEVTLFDEVPITIFTNADDPQGVWALTGVGASSEHVSIAYLTVLPPQ